MSLDIEHLDDGCYKVCLTEDGFTSCTVVSSMHLVEDKVPQLKRANHAAAIEAFNDAA